MGTFVAGCGWPRVMPLRKTTYSCSFVTNRDLLLFFLRVASFLSWKRTAAPSEQRRAAASAFRSSTLMILLLERDQQKFDDRSVTHLRVQVTAPCGLSQFIPVKKKGGVPRRNHDGIPSATSPILSKQCAVVSGFYRKRRPSHLQGNIWCQESQDVQPELRREPQICAA